MYFALFTIVKMTWLLILLGTVCSVSSKIPWIAIGSSAGAGSAVISGASMGINLAGLSYRVVCTVEIENWTKYPLIYPESKVNGGKMKIPPGVVLPGKKEQFTAHKTGYTATGSYGTASWLIAGKNRRLVVMWSCPFNFHFYSNRLGVGFTTPGQTSHQDWFDQMYYNYSGSGLNFKRGEYSDSTKTLSYEDDLFEVTGIMGTSHHTKAHIIIRPLSISDLAVPLKRKLKNYIERKSTKSYIMIIMNRRPNKLGRFIREGKL